MNKLLTLVLLLIAAGATAQDLKTAKYQRIEKSYGTKTECSSGFLAVDCHSQQAKVDWEVLVIDGKSYWLQAPWSPKEPLYKAMPGTMFQVRLEDKRIVIPAEKEWSYKIARICTEDGCTQWK